MIQSEYCPKLNLNWIYFFCLWHFLGLSTYHRKILILEDLTSFCKSFQRTCFQLFMLVKRSIERQGKLLIINIHCNRTWKLQKFRWNARKGFFCCWKRAGHMMKKCLFASAFGTLSFYLVTRLLFFKYICSRFQNF